MIETPGSIEAEQVVIGCLFLKNELIADVISELTTEHFFDNHHQQIFKAMAFACESGHPCDAMTVTEIMNNAGDKPDMGYIGEIINNTPSTMNFKSYVKSGKRIWAAASLQPLKKE